MKKVFIIFCVLFYFTASAQNNFDSSLHKANEFLLLNKTDASINILDSTLKNLENNQQKQQALQLMSNAWNVKGNQLKSLQYHNEMLLLKDSLSTVQNTTTIQALKNNYEEEKQAKELKEIQGEQKEIAWGSQIRSYVLHPYSLVKDNRSLYESNNPKDVLDGNLDDFIYAYLKSRIQEGGHEE